MNIDIDYNDIAERLKGITFPLDMQIITEVRRLHPEYNFNQSELMDICDKVVVLLGYDLK
jgi:hypothetical protein